jgi:hypothetical protein
MHFTHCITGRIQNASARLERLATPDPVRLKGSVLVSSFCLDGGVPSESLAPLCPYALQARCRAAAQLSSPKWKLRRK